MVKVLERFPGARRALFSNYHIGGCQSCAYDDAETLASVCKRNELILSEVIQTITQSHKEDLQFLIEPEELQQLLEQTTDSFILVDTRTREEHEALQLPGSILLTQELQTRYFSSPPSQNIIFYDHTGRNTLDTCSWFAGHGIKNCRALRGGIDAYAKEVDSSIPRYRLEVDDA